METQNFTPAQSIKTIEEALKLARAERTGAFFYYILWGVLLFIHFALQYGKIRYPEIDGGLLNTLIWIVFPVGGLLSFLRSKKDDRAEKMSSLYEKVYLFAFSGFALAYGVIFIVSAPLRSFLHIALFPLLLGLAVFVPGGITKHKPSIIAGVIGIICTGISLNVSLEIKYLLAALSSFITCVVPGYLMKNKNV